jgi:DNA-directed RNA polymerase specialized sigma24 family protein
MARLSVEVAARRWEHGWELHVSDERGPLVVLPTRRLSAAERTARDFVACHHGVSPRSVQVRITVTLDPALDEEIAAVRAAVDDAERAQRATAARSRALALRLRAAGLTGAEIAVVLGVSPQRVSQLMRGGGC